MLEVNQFGMEPVLGQADLSFHQNTKSCIIKTDITDEYVSGQWVKLADVAGKALEVEAVDANTDEVFGVITFNPKDVKRTGGDAVEVAGKGNVVYLRATGAIARGAQVAVDVSQQGGVTATLSGVTIVGYALDKAAADGDLIRVELATPSFAEGA